MDSWWFTLRHPRAQHCKTRHYLREFVWCDQAKKIKGSKLVASVSILPPTHEYTGMWDFFFPFLLCSHLVINACNPEFLNLKIVIIIQIFKCPQTQIENLVALKQFQTCVIRDYGLWEKKSLKIFRDINPPSPPFVFLVELNGKRPPTGWILPSARPGTLKNSLAYMTYKEVLAPRCLK